MAAISAAFLSGLLLFVSVQSLAYANDDPATTKYIMVVQSADPQKREEAKCIANNNCYLKRLTCPKQCPKRSSTKPGKSACFIDCSHKCETSCKHRKPNCYGYGAVCYDPRFVGGDGIMFYFHGKAGQDFCLVSDRNLHINAHFIGKRPEGRTRDYTWVQALGIMFDNHKFSVGAKKVAIWDNEVDQLLFSYDGQEFTIPAGSASTWASPEDLVRVERLADTNSVQITVDGIMTVSTNVVPITKNEDKVHNYQIPKDDCFAHLDVQFKFYQLSTSVDGVLGQTYQPEFKNPVKVGVPMPIMGGDDKFWVSSLFSKDCKANKFASGSDAISSNVIEMPSAKCTSTSTAGGIICRR